ncbi:unnamed protein product [Larinioides sclopetarius]|uniref:Uncharacterized protein n=1 Tax=Larinioides sclopetarius TaxID=280406 RepID=A0AAV2ABV7_9ARAC
MVAERIVAGFRHSRILLHGKSHQIKFKTADT